jgi:hypothetical protein
MQLLQYSLQYNGPQLYLIYYNHVIFSRKLYNTSAIIIQLIFQGSVNVYWELLKWLIGMSNHTFIGITTALVEKWGIEHGCEHHRYLIGQCSQLYEELQVRHSFVLSTIWLLF